MKRATFVKKINGALGDLPLFKRFVVKIKIGFYRITYKLKSLIDFYIIGDKQKGNDLFDKKNTSICSIFIDFGPKSASKDEIMITYDEEAMSHHFVNLKPEYLYDSINNIADTFVKNMSKNDTNEVKGQGKKKRNKKWSQMNNPIIEITSGSEGSANRSELDRKGNCTNTNFNYKGYNFRIDQKGCVVFRKDKRDIITTTCICGSYIRTTEISRLQRKRFIIQQVPHKKGCDQPEINCKSNRYISCNVTHSKQGYHMSVPNLIMFNTQPCDLVYAANRIEHSNLTTGSIFAGVAKLLSKTKLEELGERITITCLKEMLEKAALETDIQGITRLTRLSPLVNDYFYLDMLISTPTDISSILPCSLYAITGTCTLVGLIDHKLYDRVYNVTLSSFIDGTTLKNMMSSDG